ncbi:MAG: HEAT repeat domain-containing protein [Cryobacterium sp.]|nr:HEAT repeat domain-containing protein [Oligoflexia bacterium]
MIDYFRHSPLRVALAAALLASASFVALHHWRSEPVSSEEFFKRNPHLTRPEALLPPDLGPARANDSYLADDYHLMEARAYPVKVTQSSTMRAGGKSLFESGYEGQISLHSLGMKDKRVTLIAEFHYEKLKGNLKLSPKVLAELGFKNLAKNDQNLMLIRLDPSGKVLEMKVSDAAQDDASMEMKVNGVLALFRRLPSLHAGNVTRTEGDDRGVPYPIEYRITEPSGELWKIQAEVKVAQMLGTSMKKAAAVGAPDLALIGLEDEQKQSFTWLWDRKVGLPRRQDSEASAGIKQMGNDLSNSQVQATANWEPSVEARFTRADEARFKTDVNFKRFSSLSGDRLKSLKKLSKKDGLGRNWSYFSDLSRKIRDPKMSDAERDEFSVDYARALRDDPGHIAEVKNLAMNSASGSREVSMALGALGFEGSAESQAAMIEVFSRPGATEDEKQKVMSEFTLSPGVLSPETKTFLQFTLQQASPLQSQISAGAGLAIGSSISKDGDRTMVKVLQKEWDQTTSLFSNKNEAENMQTYLLTAMGNSKGDSFLNEAKSAARSSNQQVRSAAVNSVRFAQDEESRALLVKALETDPDTDVRITAVRSLSYQPFDALTRSSLDKCTGSSDLGMKIECYRVLAARIEQPGVRALLESRYGSESDPQVRGVLSAALAVKTEDAK